MKNHLLTFAVLALAIANPARAQQSSEVPVHVVVTVEARKGPETPVINREDVMVHEDHDREPVIDWVPAQGEHWHSTHRPTKSLAPMLHNIPSRNRSEYDRIA